MDDGPHETSRGFVVIEGASGVGKTTVTALLAQLLAERGLPVVATKEPSDAAIGQLARHGTNDYGGLALACLVTADSYHHLMSDIRPALQAGSIVLCDRYVPTSLVLQRLDGVEPVFLAHLNQHADVPDLTIFLTGDPARSAERARQRGTYSRFHDEDSQIEAALYGTIADELVAEGWPVIQHEVADQSAEQVANALQAVILERLGFRSG